MQTYSLSTDRHKVTFAVCVPEICSAEEIELITSTLMGREVVFSDDDCQDKVSPDLTQQSIATM